MNNHYTYFKDCKNLNDVKMTYKKLIKTMHPDLGGDTEQCKILNNEFESAFEFFKNLDNESIKDDAKKSYENVNVYKNIIEKLIHYDINIEIVGSWIWLDGNTYPIKEQIKELAFRWSKSKKKWYYFENIENENKKRGFYSYEKIVEKYGATKIDNDPFKRI